MPSPWRSSGMRPTRAAVQPAGVVGAAACSGPSRIVPSEGWRRPVSTDTSACWPLPATPAMATISCVWTTRSRLSRRGAPSRLSRTVTWDSVTTGAACSAAEAASARGMTTLRPTISSASSAGLVLAVSRSATSLPCRSTATRRDTAITSSSLCEMKMTASPSSTKPRNVANRSCTSCGVRTAVGSSRISTRAPRYSAFRISTRCFSPTDSVPTRASGSTPRPKRWPSSTRRLRAWPRPEASFQSDSVPTMMLSSTVRLSASVKC